MSFSEDFDAAYEDRRLLTLPTRARMYELEKNRLLRIRSDILAFDKKILDIGGSSGYFLHSLRANHKLSFNLEINQAALENSCSLGITPYDWHQFFHSDSKFDLIIFRGTIQHLVNPFDVISRCYQVLNDGGFLVFLSTPNSDSPYYLINKYLKVLEPSSTWLIPSRTILTNTSLRVGFKLVKEFYPYFETPYASPIRDLLFFFLNTLFKNRFKNYSFPFSMMELYFIKPF